MQNNELLKAIEILCSHNVQKITLSNKYSELCEYKKASIRATDKGYIVERFTERQAFHKNISRDELKNLLITETTENFRQVNAICEGFDIEIKISKKGKVLFNKRKNDKTEPLPQNIGANRIKNYILPENIFVPALYELGVMTSEGKVVASKYDKFKQINRFIECVDDAFKNSDEDNLEIIDFGCGKSYLTFILYYYMTEIRHKNVSIIGLDLKKDVIEKCNAVAKKYNYAGLKFLCGDIKDYKPQKNPDMVVTLHACDTATDFALYNAVSWNAKYIFSVPCCQHELNSSISSDAFPIITEFGLLKERFCALATDALRAKILQAKGYKVDILEFIDMENSPKNILIRAKKNKTPNPYKLKTIEDKISDFEKATATKLTLYRLFCDNNNER